MTDLVVHGLLATSKPFLPGNMHFSRWWGGKVQYHNDKLSSPGLANSNHSFTAHRTFGSAYELVWFPTASKAMPSKRSNISLPQTCLQDVADQGGVEVGSHWDQTTLSCQLGDGWHSPKPHQNTQTYTQTCTHSDAPNNYCTQIVRYCEHKSSSTRRTSARHYEYLAGSIREHIKNIQETWSQLRSDWDRKGVTKNQMEIPRSQDSLVPNGVWFSALRGGIRRRVAAAERG